MAPQQQPAWQSAPAVNSSRVPPSAPAPQSGGFVAPPGEALGTAAHFQAMAPIQANADNYVKQKWQEYGQIAQQSEGQAIRDYSKRVFGFTPDQQPEKDLENAVYYVQASVPQAQLEQLENQWRQEYLRTALPQAMAAQQAAANPAPPLREVGRVRGLIDAALKGTADVVTKPVASGTQLFYALGDHSDTSGLHGANATQTPNEQHAATSMQALEQLQSNIDQAYPQSTAAAQSPHGLQAIAESTVQMLPAFAMTGRAFSAGGLQKVLALAQIGSTGFGDSYQSVYQSAKAQGMSDADANAAALGGGLVSSIVNTALMRYGALARTPEAQPLFRRAITLAVTDALAQGGVGTGQGLVDEATRYVATGDAPRLDNIIRSAVNNAGAGLVFGGARGAMERPATPGIGRQTPDVTRQNPSAGEQSIPALPPEQSVAVPPGKNGAAPATALPESVRQATPTIESGPEQGQPVRFASDLDKARHIAETYRGPIQRDALNYLHSLASAASSREQPALQPEGSRNEEAATGGPAALPPGEPKPLPSLLETASPKYRLTAGDQSRGVAIDFDSPIDKAAWLSTLPTRGKLSAEADKYLAAAGYTPEETRQRGEQLRSRADDLVKQSPPTAGNRLKLSLQGPSVSPEGQATAEPVASVAEKTSNTLASNESAPSTVTPRDSEATRNGEQRGAAGQQPPASSPTSESEPAMEAGGPAKLPPSVESAKPAFPLKTGVESVRVPVDFDSAKDRALYLATAAKKGKIAADAAAWLQRQGHAPAEIEAEGTALRERMARLAKAGQLDEGDRLRVPAKTAEQTGPITSPIDTRYRFAKEQTPAADIGNAAKDAGQAAPAPATTPKAEAIAAVRDSSPRASAPESVRDTAASAASPVRRRAKAGALPPVPSDIRTASMADIREWARGAGYNLAGLESFGPDRFLDALGKQRAGSNGTPSFLPDKDLHEQTYPHSQEVTVVHPDGMTHIDEVKGLNEGHALYRGRKNWEGAEVEPTRRVATRGRDYLPQAETARHDETLQELNPDARRVDADTLPESHREVLDVARELTGKDAIPYTGGKGRGFHVNGDVYYNVERNKTPQQQRETIAHESAHWLQDNRPELVKPVADAVTPAMRSRFAAEYESNYTRQEGKPLPPEQRQRELEAYTVGKAFARPSVARAVMERNPGAFTRAADAVLTKLRSVTAGGRLTNQVIATLRQARDEAAGTQSTPAPSHGDLLPASAKFADEENPIVRMSREVAEGAKALGKVAERFIAPGAASKGLDLLKGNMRASWAKQDLDRIRLEEKLKPALAMAHEAGEAGNTDSIKAIEAGKPVPDARLQPVADELQRAFAQDRQDAAATGIDTSKWETNWLGRIFEFPDSKSGTGWTVSEAGAERYLRARDYDNYEDALAAVKAAGGRPKYDTWIETGLAKHLEIRKSIEGRDLFQRMEGRGQIAPFGPKEELPDGWKYLDDKLATRYAPPDFRKVTRNGVAKTVATENVSARYAAPEIVSNLLNDHLSPGLTEKLPLWRQFVAVNRGLTSLNLGLSGAHTINMATGGMALNIAQALDNLGHGEYGLAAKNALRSAVAPVYNAILGGKVRAEAREPGTHPEVAPLLNAEVAGGARMGVDSILNKTAWAQMQSAWDKGQPIRAGGWFANAAWRSITAPLFNHYIPAIKAGSLAIRAETELSRLGPIAGAGQVERAMGRHSDLVDNALGQVVRENKFQHKVVSDFLNGVLMAPEWNEGLLRLMGGAGRDYAKAAVELTKAISGQGGRPELTPNMLMPFGAILSYMAAGAATNLALTGQTPQSLRDYFQPRSGKKDDDGKDIRLSILTPFKDVPNWLSKPGHTTWNKLSPIIHLAQELATNSDYRGVEIHNPADSLGHQATDIAKHAGETALPFSVRAYERLQEANRSPMSGADKVERILGDVAQSASGLNPISRYESMSPAEQKAEDLMHEQFRRGTVTPEQDRHTQILHQLSAALRTRQPDAFDRIRDAFHAGEITEGDMRAIREQQMPSLERDVRSLTVERGMSVLNEANPDEQRRIIPALMQKVRAAKELGRAERVAYMAQLQAAWKNIRGDAGRPVPAGSMRGGEE